MPLYTTSPGLPYDDRIEGKRTSQTDCMSLSARSFIFWHNHENDHLEPSNLPLYIYHTYTRVTMSKILLPPCNDQNLQNLKQNPTDRSRNKFTRSEQSRLCFVSIIQAPSCGTTACRTRRRLESNMTFHCDELNYWLPWATR